MTGFENLTSAGIELTNFKWFLKKKQGAKYAKAHCSGENFGASWIVFHMFFGICRIKKNYQRKSSTLKHAVVNNNNF